MGTAVRWVWKDSRARTETEVLFHLAQQQSRGKPVVHPVNSLPQATHPTAPHLSAPLKERRQLNKWPPHDKRWEAGSWVTSCLCNSHRPSIQGWAAFTFSANAGTNGGEASGKGEGHLAVKARHGTGQQRGDSKVWVGGARTAPFPLADGGVVADADHLGGAPRGGALARLPHDVGEGQLHVLLGCLQPKKLCVEEHEGVEKDKGRVDAQLLTLPQVLLLHAREDCICNSAGRGPVRTGAPPSLAPSAPRCPAHEHFHSAGDHFVGHPDTPPHDPVGRGGFLCGLHLHWGLLSPASSHAQADANLREPLNSFLFFFPNPVHYVWSQLFRHKSWSLLMFEDKAPAPAATCTCPRTLCQQRHTRQPGTWDGVSEEWQKGRRAR